MSRLQRRLKKELEELQKSPIENCSAGPIDDDIQKWQATIFGPEETPYYGGIFYVNIELH